ncbi:hypothetical protein BDQ17DRAFT_1333845 [Cyathus striatus]|nr:hypothetical protein BDQ17DRAFT_1333845 [Cyathus striatus]
MKMEWMVGKEERDAKEKSRQERLTVKKWFQAAEHQWNAYARKVVEDVAAGIRDSSGKLKGKIITLQSQTEMTSGSINVAEASRPHHIFKEDLQPDNSQNIGWIDHTEERAHWSKNTLKHVAAGNKPGGLTMRVGILVQYPTATAAILTYLHGLRWSSVPLTLSVIHGIMIGQLQYLAPTIFKVPSSDGSLLVITKGNSCWKEDSSKC